MGLQHLKELQEQVDCIIHSCVKHYFHIFIVCIFIFFLIFCAFSLILKQERNIFYFCLLHNSWIICEEILVCNLSYSSLFKAFIFYLILCLSFHNPCNILFIPQQNSHSTPPVFNFQGNVSSLDGSLMINQ